MKNKIKMYAKVLATKKIYSIDTLYFPNEGEKGGVRLRTGKGTGPCDNGTEYFDFSEIQILMHK